MTSQKLILCAKSFPNNPYDDHTLADQIEQTNILLMNQNVGVKTAYVNLGYRGVDESLKGVTIIHRCKTKTTFTLMPVGFTS